MQQPELIVIKTQEGINELTEYLKGFEYVAYDSETTGLARNATVVGFSICCEPDRAYYIPLHYFSGGLLQPTLIDPTNAKRVVTSLLHKQVICHNAIFDCIMAQAYFGVPLINALHTDTMVLAHLLDENRRIALKELAKDMYGQNAADEQAEMKASVIANGGQVTKDNYEMYKADVDILGKYGAKDAWITYNLFLDLVPQLEEEGLYDFFYNEESMPLLKTATFELNDTGLNVDVQALKTLQKTLEAEIAADRAFINEAIAPLIKDKYPGDKKKNTFNIDSSSQMAWLMFGVMGLEFGSLTKEGKTVAKHLLNRLPYTPGPKRAFITECEARKDEVYQPEATVNGKRVRAKKIRDPWVYTECGKEVIEKYAPHHLWIARLKDYKKRIKLLSTYVEGLQERITYGVLHPQFKQTGTTSGRYSSSNPNFQNLPRDDKRIKDCIIARPGKTFVGADYAQLEPRVFAFQSQDQRLMETFASGKDFYSVIGMGVYGKFDCEPYKDGTPDAFGIKYKQLRDLSKILALAPTYGATSFQLAKTTRKAPTETQEDIDAYFEQFPLVKKLMTDSHAMAKRDGYVTNLFGRKRRIPQAKYIPKGMSHEELPYEARTLLNLAVNHRVQSTAASIVNRAAIRFLSLCKDAYIPVKLVLQVHDSLVAECKEEDAENVALLLQEAMENTTILPGVKLEAIPAIGKSLGKV